MYPAETKQSLLINLTDTYVGNKMMVVLFTVLRLPQMTFFYGFVVKALQIFIAIGMFRAFLGI